MKRRTISEFLLFFAITLHPINGVADDDDDSTETSGDWWALEMDDREENSFGISPEDDALFGRQDCIDNITFTIDVTVSSSVLDGDRGLYLYIGDDCNDDDEIDDCLKIADESLSSLTYSFQNIAFADIFGDLDCDDRESVYLWVADLEDEGIIDTSSEDSVVHAATLIFDGSGPDTTVEIDKVWIGNDNIEIDFDPSDSSDVEGYVALYVRSSDADCTGGTLAAGDTPTASAIDGLAVTWFDDDSVITISGLENGQYYQVALATLDGYGNPSAVSTPVCTSPADSIGFGEELQSDGEYCFIATAAFGSYNHGTVRQLRRFRDQFLKHVPLGNTFIRVYYRIGPFLARSIEKDESRRRQVQTALQLMAGCSILLIKAGPHNVVLSISLAVLLGLAGGFYFSRKKGM